MSATAGPGPVRPLVSWHRGGAEVAPFATLPAFSSAAASSAELIEVDVRQSADKVLLCVHDPVVPGIGRIEEVEWARLGEPARTSGRVFEFEELLSALDAKDPARLSRIHLDLKAPGYEDPAVSAVLAHERPVTVTSGEASSVRAVRRLHPDVPVVLTIGSDGRGLSRSELFGLRAGELLPFAEIERCGATGVAAHFLLATPLLRTWCRYRGLELLVWTVDDDRGLSKWLGRRDVDVVTTNRPMAALKIRDGATPAAVEASR